MKRQPQITYFVVCSDIIVRNLRRRHALESNSVANIIALLNINVKVMAEEIDSGWCNIVADEIA